MMKKAAALIVILGTAGLAGAEKIQLREDTFFTLSALLQPQAGLAENAAPNGDMGTDFMVRRMRLILGAQVMKGFSFFFETEQANLGKDGNWDTSVFIQDAFVSVEPVKGLIFDAGMMLIPFTRHNMQSAATLNGLDYHANLIKFPAGGQRVWRDAGLQARVDVDRLHARAGVFNGVEGAAATTSGTTTTPMRNSGDRPRAAAHVRADILGTDTGTFFSGITFASAPVLSAGVGVDWQPDLFAETNGVMGPGDSIDHLAFAGDVFAEIPTTTNQELVLQTTGVLYDDGDKNTTTGLGLFTEAGYRIAWVEPIFAFEIFNADADADKGDWRAFRLGVNFWIEKHKANVKLDTALTRTSGGDDVKSAALQAQLFF